MPNRDYARALSARLAFELDERFEARHLSPFWVAAAAGRLPLAAYQAHLTAWAALWAEMEGLGSLEGAPVFNADLSFGGLLRADVGYLAPLTPALPAEPTRAAAALTRMLRTAVRAEPVTYLGALYVGLRLLTEARIFDECAKGAFGLSVSGRSFWRFQLLGAEMRFTELCLRLDALPPEGRAADRIEAAARTMLAAYLDVERVIEPGTDLVAQAALAAQRTPSGGLAPPRPNQRARSDELGCGILRGAPHGRKPR